MSQKLDTDLQTSGTRFRLFPQPRFLPGFEQPEVVYVSPPPANSTDLNKIRRGPADNRMFVVDAIEKRPYDTDGPPYLGRRNEPIDPGTDGHFDHVEPGTRAFSCATMYSTVRRVLDIWTDFFRREIPWHFRTELARLELIPLIEWDNAQSGWGFLEFGFGRLPGGGIDRDRPYCENFDVLAHELGHSIIFSEVGIPRSRSANTLDYGGFHESSGDLVAILSTLHFNSVVDHLLTHTKGNLFTSNELSRLGELSASRQIRVAFNYARMSTVGSEPHDRSLPLTGGIFDVLVEAFQRELLDRNLISPSLAERSNHELNSRQNEEAIQRDFEAAYSGNEEGFKDSLLTARDYLGFLLADAWKRISPDFLSYEGVVTALLDADQQLARGRFQDTIRRCFSWREIGTLRRDSLFAKPIRLSDCEISLPYDLANAARVPGGLNLIGLTLGTHAGAHELLHLASPSLAGAALRVDHGKHTAGTVGKETAGSEGGIRRSAEKGSLKDLLPAESVTHDTDDAEGEPTKPKRSALRDRLSHESVTDAADGGFEEEISHPRMEETPKRTKRK